ncbi:MAG: tRNA lysidine(34) synthetase TilS [Nitrospirae bacterium]|nr:tRNA lysidine(34) synthetase TilS [Nitrospirota bacterium]
MDLIEKTFHTIRKYSMLAGRDGVLAALSGGADSVCLLTILCGLRERLDINIHAAYIDHGLRPDETPAEISFCRDLCGSLKVPFSSKSIDVKAFAAEHGMNKQEAARELRYKALEDTALTVGAARIALGHTADDQAETVIMRLFAGSGTLGLSGIPPVRKNIIRPLISVTRKEIEGFLDAAHIGFITDSSNLKDKYMRNRVRQSVMPALKALAPDAVRTIARTADILREEDLYLENQVTKILMKLISRKSDTSIELFVTPLEKIERPLARRVLRRAVSAVKGLRGISFSHIEAMLDLMKAGRAGDRTCLPQGIRAIKGYSTFIITCDSPQRLDSYIVKGPGDVVINEASIVLTCAYIDAANADNGQFNCDGKKLAVFDTAKLHFPLTVRSRKPGDAFFPSGFGKKKKLQDYFVDEKVPRDIRDSVPLLINDEEIVWVIGYRADARFIIDKNTVNALKFEITLLNK